MGLPARTLSTEPHNSMKLVFTLERAFNRDTSVICKPRSLVRRVRGRRLRQKGTAAHVLQHVTCVHKTSCASTWFVKEHNISKKMLLATARGASCLATRILSVSRNTARNPSINLHHVHRHVRAVTRQIGGRCHGHRSPFPTGCRSRSVQYWHVPTSEFVIN